MSDQKICPTCGTEYPLSERFCPRDGTALRNSGTQSDLIGSVVADRYHVLKKLGEGGMGTVYLAEHVKMGRKAALKVMNPGMTADTEAIARFNREAANASRLNHPNVCGIYDFGETSEGLIYLAMEFVEGESLTSLIQKNGFLAAPRAASIIHQAADALAVAHDYGIVHRDLKPDNIMIARARDGGDQVKVVDFGIAKASTSDAQKVTKTGLVVGTPEYMSPEQLSGDKLDGRSDIYSLGLVAFNCLTGTLPFQSESAQEAMIMRLTDRPLRLTDVRPEIPWTAELLAVMDKVLTRDVNARYQKSSDFGRDIAKAVETMPATVAAQAGTMVMAAAPAEATAVLPKTRMAAKSSGTVKMDVPDSAQTVVTALPKKSSLLIVAAAVVVIGGIGTALWMKGAAPNAPPANAAPARSDTAPATSGDHKTADPAAQPAAPGGAPAAQKAGVQLLAKSDAPGTKDPATSSPPSSDSPSQVLARWARVVDDPNLTASDATHAVDALTPITPKLIGRERSNAYYLEMVAYLKLDDDPHFCTVAKQVIATDPNANHVSTAQAALAGRCN